MGYLICGECGGYYELEQGESPENFEKCECGGKLRYRKTVEGLKNYGTNDKVSYNDNNLEKIKLKSIGIGAISSLLIILSIFLPKLLLKYNTDEYAIVSILFIFVLAPLIGGFIASYSCKRCNYKYGVVNSIIGIFIYNIVIILIEYFYLQLGQDFIGYLFFALVIEIFGIIGAVLGIFIKNMLADK